MIGTPIKAAHPVKLTDPAIAKSKLSLSVFLVILKPENKIQI